MWVGSFSQYEVKTKCDNFCDGCAVVKCMPFIYKGCVGFKISRDTSGEME